VKINEMNMTATLRGRTITTDEVIAACQIFDQSERRNDQWLSHPWQEWVFIFDGQIYPPKHVLSIATGIPRRRFRGGPAEANAAVAELGFPIIRKDEAKLVGY
jgi:5-methylcytosine-specific restriction protein A